MLLDRVKQMLTEKFPEEKISCKTDERNIVTLQGECSDLRLRPWRACATW